MKTLRYIATICDDKNIRNNVMKRTRITRRARRHDINMDESAGKNHKK